MQCPKCQFDNPGTRKFCRECGASLEKLCPKCNSKNLPGDKFCGECGCDLTVPPEHSPRELSFDEKLDKIQRYLPQGLTEKILAQRDRIEGERKQVTVMFCDMEGFTPLVEKVGPDEAYAIIDQVYEILIHKVHDYEGTVNEMTGDGIMALFGAPIALEDAPQRAIRSALAIHREIAKSSDRMKEDGFPPLKMRIGIHTGTVVVGTLGNNLRVEFKAVGDTVNVASRIEGSAQPGTTYVSGDTFNLTKGFFRFEALGEKKVKGKEQPIKVYRVLEASTRRTRFDVSAERGLTPHVGRERELELLLDAFERSKAGRGQAMSIVSEAGVGKSRLLYEFRKTLSNENITFLEGKCLSYSRNVSYHPVADILKANFDIQEGDDDSKVTERVKKGLKALAADESSTLPYLLEVLSVKDSGIDKIPMSPEAKTHRIASALNHIVLKGSEISPLVLAFEDLHWIDRSSEDALKSLLDNIPGVKVLLILTYRPEYVGTWGGKSYHSQVNLNRLSNRESLAMVAHLLGTENIASDLEELVLEKTEGVPFFIEEFLLSLKNLKIITKAEGKYQLGKEVKAVTIPSTVQDVIMARVDALPEGAKEVLQTGSVIEREFSYQLIQQVMDFSDTEIITHLSALKDSELLYERGIYPETSYIFKHALTRDVVYDSILSKKRKMLHDKIGHAVEDTYKEHIGEHVAILTEHFTSAENYEKGAEYAKLARKKAQKAGSFNDAIEYGKKGLFCLERLLKTEENQKKAIDETTAIAAYYMNLGNVLGAWQTISVIADLVHRLNYEKRLPGIYTVMALYNFYIEENYPEGFTLIHQALETSEKRTDYLSYWIANYFLGALLSWNCEFEEGLSCFEKCDQLSVLAKNPIGISNTKSNMIVNNYVLSGKIDLAWRTGQQTLQLANETDDILAKGLANISYGVACYHKGLLSEGENTLLAGVNFCEQISQIMWIIIGYSFLGNLYCDMQKYEAAAEFFNKAIRAAEGAKMLPSWISWWKLCLTRIAAFNNVPDIHQDVIFQQYSDIKIKILEGWIANCIGDILLNLGDQHMNEAEQWISKAIEANSKNGAMYYLGRDHVLYADLLIRRGDLVKAREHLTRGIEIHRECGADGWAKKYEEDLLTLT
jgi:class 3 adenylate cyclase/tetratricopeptide (TPR) repeat protein